ncbi:MAG: hypothetical protein R3E66_10550 [bacterium]
MKLVYEEAEVIVSGVIPLLERIGTERARGALSELAQSDDNEVKKTAAAALLRLRNGQEWIDAEFDDSF